MPTMTSASRAPRQPPSRCAEDLVLAPELPALRARRAASRYQCSQALESPYASRGGFRSLLRRAPLIGKQLDCEVELAERHPCARHARAGRAAVAPLASARGLLAKRVRSALRQGDADPHGYGRREGGRHGCDNGGMTGLSPAPWWTVRRAEPQARDVSLSILRHHLRALSEHMLIAPKGHTHRRHAHTECVLQTRNGETPLREEWLAHSRACVAVATADGRGSAAPASVPDFHVLGLDANDQASSPGWRSG